MIREKLTFLTVMVAAAVAMNLSCAAGGGTMAVPAGNSVGPDKSGL